MNEYTVILRSDENGWSDFEMICQAQSFGEAEQSARRVYDDLACTILSISRELHNG